MPEGMDMWLQADMDLLNEFDTEAGEMLWEETVGEEMTQEGLDYYYNMMLPELQEGKFTSDDKLDFVRKLLSA